MHTHGMTILTNAKTDPAGQHKNISLPEQLLGGSGLSPEEVHPLPVFIDFSDYIPISRIIGHNPVQSSPIDTSPEEGLFGYIRNLLPEKVSCSAVI